MRCVSLISRKSCPYVTLGFVCIASYGLKSITTLLSRASPCQRNARTVYDVPLSIQERRRNIKWTTGVITVDTKRTIDDLTTSLPCGWMLKCSAKPRTSVSTRPLQRAEAVPTMVLIAAWLLQTPSGLSPTRQVRSTGRRVVIQKPTIPFHWTEFDRQVAAKSPPAERT